MTSHPPSACLFDLDGLLLDTEPIYTQVTQAIVGRYGHTYDWSLKGNMLGRPALDSARYLVRALALPITAEAYLAQRDQLLYQHFANCQAMPGAQRLVCHLQAQGIPIAVATSSKRELYTVKTQHHQDWFSLFSVVVTGDDPDLARGKPAPDIFLLAAARLGISPQRALVFEDAPSGLAAGLAAGMRVVAVPDPNMDKSRYAAADVILDSLQQFRPQVYGLPRF